MHAPTLKTSFQIVVDPIYRWVAHKLKTQKRGTGKALVQLLKIYWKECIYYILKPCTETTQDYSQLMKHISCSDNVTDDWLIQLPKHFVMWHASAISRVHWLWWRSVIEVCAKKGMQPQSSQWLEKWDGTPPFKEFQFVCLSVLLHFSKCFDKFSKKTLSH